MSVQSEITRISSNVTAALAAIADKGVTVPDGATSDDLHDLIVSIESGAGGSVKDVLYETIRLSFSDSSIYIGTSFMPNCVVIVGDVNGGSSSMVGLAVHVEDENGNVYQEKWRFQSTKYLVGTTATDGSLFTISKLGDNYIISINSSEQSFGTLFGAKTYKIFAAKIF